MPKVAKCAVVLTADQVASRSEGDRVPEALEALVQLPEHGPASDARSFVRTAGDEIQALFTRSSEAIDAVERLEQLGNWRVGIGIGSVRTPVPADVRAAQGGAFIAARQAIVAAGKRTSALAVFGDEGVSATGCARVQTALDLLELVWRRRRETSWEVARFIELGMTQQAAAQRLGITPSAVSQRIANGAIDEALAGKHLAAWLLDEVRSNRELG